MKLKFSRLYVLEFRTAPKITLKRRIPRRDAVWDKYTSVKGKPLQSERDNRIRATFQKESNKSDKIHCSSAT